MTYSERTFCLYFLSCHTETKMDLLLQIFIINKNELLFCPTFKMKKNTTLLKSSKLQQKNSRKTPLRGNTLSTGRIGFKTLKIVHIQIDQNSKLKCRYSDIIYIQYFIIMSITMIKLRDHRGHDRDHMVVGLTIYLCNQCLSHLKLPV